MATRSMFGPSFQELLPEIINTHNYQAMYYPDGSYAGINEIIFNFKHWLDWYLEATGQRLVGGSGPAIPCGS